MDLSVLKFDDRGLIPVVAQDAADGTVLMLAWANRDALEQTMATGWAVYFSRSRGKLWEKGEESGNRQKIVEVLVDCDGDAVIYKVVQVGGVACHTGHRSCFYRTLRDGKWIENAPVINDPKEMYK